MDIAIYGATGNIGSRIVEEAVRRGHDVTAISRTGGANDNVSVLRADLADTEEFSRVAGEHDVVVIASGPSRTGDPHSHIVEAHRALIASKPPARIVVIGGAGSLYVGDQRLKDLPDFPEMFKPEAETMTRVLDLYEASSGLDWTVLSPPPMIAPGERTEGYKVGDHSPAGDSISQEDFAVAVLDEIEKPAHRNARFTVAN